MKLADDTYRCRLCGGHYKGIARFTAHFQIRHPREARKARKETKNV